MSKPEKPKTYLIKAKAGEPARMVGGVLLAPGQPRELTEVQMRLILLALKMLGLLGQYVIEEIKERLEEPAEEPAEEAEPKAPEEEPAPQPGADHPGRGPRRAKG